MIDTMIADILADFSDDEGVALVEEEFVSRSIERALMTVGFDLGVSYDWNEGEPPTITPVMPIAHREVLSLRAHILVCRSLRAKAATRLDFSSADKRISRSNEAKHWQEMEKSLLDEYKSLVRKINPSMDDTFIQLEAAPIVYVRGAAAEFEESE